MSLSKRFTVFRVLLIAVSVASVCAIVVLGVYDQSLSYTEYRDIREVPAFSKCSLGTEIGPVSVCKRRTSYDLMYFIKGRAAKDTLLKFVREIGLDTLPSAELSAEDAVSNYLKMLPADFSEGIAFGPDDIFIFGVVGCCGFGVKGAHLTSNESFVLILREHR